MLKPIPQENTLQKNKNKTLHLNHDDRSQGNKKNISHWEELSSKDDHQHHSRMVKKLCLNLMNYLKKAEEYSLDEMNLLIEHLQKSTLTLQKKRLKLVKQKSKK